jgi:hypothetical protein
MGIQFTEISESDLKVLQAAMDEYNGHQEA